MWLARTRPCASSLGITFSKNFHVWALFSKTLYLWTLFSRNLYLRAWAACAQPCHRGPCCSHLLHRNTANDKSNRIATTCNNLTPTTLKATELPRLATSSHLPLYTVQLMHWTLNATLLHHTFLRFEKTQTIALFVKEDQSERRSKFPDWLPLPQTHPWHVRTTNQKAPKQTQKERFTQTITKIV